QDLPVRLRNLRLTWCAAPLNFSRAISVQFRASLPSEPYLAPTASRISTSCSPITCTTKPSAPASSAKPASPNNFPEMKVQSAISSALGRPQHLHRFHQAAAHAVKRLRQLANFIFAG